MRLGTDTGGTFTDVITPDGRSAKVLSDRQDPAGAVRRGLEAVGEPAPDVLAHGTTVATNALLERRGGEVALLTNAGCEDLIEIARQDRPSLYDHFADRPEPLVPRERRLGLGGRLGPAGEELEPLDTRALADLPDGVEAVAVCLLHADVDPGHERAVREAVGRLGLDVSCSHEVSPEFREYERTVTTIVNAYLRPPCRRYLEALDGTAGEVLVLTSAGGLVPVSEGSDRPAALLLSGPAGGVGAGAAAAAACGYPDAVTFDMGGTSTDVCLVLDGRAAPAAERSVGGLPVRLPALDVHTIGAGGGSIARVDAGGALVVGPTSAGADPGPACYGRGGTEPTVTDANLVAGRIPADVAFAALGALDLGSAAAAIERLGIGPAADVARGILAVVDANMEQAIRAVTVERGVDPRGLALVAFGGAGPLHACGLAEALGIPAVIVPAHAGVLSALGILAARRQADVARSWGGGADLAGLDTELDAAAAAALEQLGEDGGEVEVETAVDARYGGQSHELTVPTPDDFHDEHRRRNGYARPDAAVEVVAVRATARAAPPLAIDDVPGSERSPVRGPASVVEQDCTVWVPAGWQGEPAAGGALLLTRR